MATKRTIPVKPRPSDPARDHNEKILADRKLREEREALSKHAPVDLGLKIEHKEPESAFEMLGDEFDRRNFGDVVPTYSRTVYGPHPLLEQCPGLLEQIERVGLEEYAAMTAEAIKLKGPNAVPDPMMRRGLQQAIKKFGVAKVAQAFSDRIMEIPSRIVEIEADRDEDDEIFGRPLEDAVRRWGHPGMAPKFLSERCIGALGMRGYVIVKDDHGDPVKVGTLLMGEIPIATAERRRYLAAKASDDAVRDQEDAYLSSQQRMLRDAGAVGVGSGPLSSGDRMQGNASERESLLGERLLGVQIRREAGEQ